MSVTRYFYEKLEDGSMSETPTHLGAKAEYVTIKPAEGEELLNAQSEFQRMWQMDTYLENKIDTEITDRKNAITEEVTARQNADVTLQTNINAEAEAREAAVKAEREAREAAITAEQKARDEEDDKILEALATEITDRQTAIDTAIADEIVNRNKAISDTVQPVEKKVDDLQTITLALSQFTREYIMYQNEKSENFDINNNTFKLLEHPDNFRYFHIDCEYNGKQVPTIKISHFINGDDIITIKQFSVSSIDMENNTLCSLYLDLVHNKEVTEDYPYGSIKIMNPYTVTTSAEGAEIITEINKDFKILNICAGY